MNPPSSDWRGPRLLVALALALAYLVPALFSLGDYGPTYDAIKGDYPYGERLLGYLGTGDERFLDNELREPRPTLREPHPNFDAERFPSRWAFPVGGMFSAVSCRLFWTELGWLPAQSAHNLPVVLLAAALVFAVGLFACARLGLLAGAVAAGSLFLTPSFFAHSFNNPRDLPECAFYTLAVLAGLSALESGRARSWLAAGACTGLALAQKANALFLPVQLVIFLVGLLVYARVRGIPAPRPTARGLLVAAGSFVLAYYTASPAFWAAPIDGPREWVLEMVKNGNQGLRASPDQPVKISFISLLAVLETTPLPTLVLALFGALRPRLAFPLRWFLLLGALLPIARHLIPGMRSFDGTRHFLEFLPMLCLLSGAGAAWLVEFVRNCLPARAGTLATGRLVTGRLVTGIVLTAALAPSAWAVIDTHPNQVVYFNALAGGLGTAQAKENREACDFWGNSYWQGLGWMEDETEPGSRLFVPAKDFIALAGAPVRLSEGRTLLKAGSAGPRDLPLYVMHLVNRWDDRFQRLLDQDLPPVHVIRVQNGAVLHIHLLQRDERGLALMKAWRQELERLGNRSKLVGFLAKNKALKWEAMAVVRAHLSREETLERLRQLLPEDLHDEVESLMELSEEGE